MSKRFRESIKMGAGPFWVEHREAAGVLMDKKLGTPNTTVYITLDMLTKYDGDHAADNLIDQFEVLLADFKIRKSAVVLTSEATAWVNKAWTQKKEFDARLYPGINLEQPFGPNSWINYQLDPTLWEEVPSSTVRLGNGNIQVTYKWIGSDFTRMGETFYRVGFWWRDRLVLKKYFDVQQPTGGVQDVMPQRFGTIVACVDHITGGVPGHKAYDPTPRLRPLYDDFIKSLPDKDHASGVYGFDMDVFVLFMMQPEFARKRKEFLDALDEANKYAKENHAKWVAEMKRKYPGWDENNSEEDNLIAMAKAILSGGAALPFDFVKSLLDGLLGGAASLLPTVAPYIIIALGVYIGANILMKKIDKM